MKPIRESARLACMILGMVRGHIKRGHAVKISLRLVRRTAVRITDH